MDYSTKRISRQLMEEIKTALQSVSYGSIEIFISDSSVTQITTRTIKKTSITLNPTTSVKSTTRTSATKTPHRYSQKILHVRSITDAK